MAREASVNLTSFFYINEVKEAEVGGPHFPILLIAVMETFVSLSLSLSFVAILEKYLN